MSDAGGSRRFPRAEIFFFDGYIGIAASVVSAATALTEHGYDVHLYYNEPPLDVQIPHLPGITLHRHVPWTRRFMGPVLERMRRRRLGKLGKIKADQTTRLQSAKLRSLVKAFIATVEVPQFALFCRRQSRRPDLGIAFDMNSLAAMDYAIPRTVPFIYWSLEIIMKAEIRDPLLRSMKKHELSRLSDAAAVVIQSPLRRDLLEQDRPRQPVRYVEVPNAPSEPLRPDIERDFYTTRFPVPTKARIVLQSGFISTSLLSQEIAESTRDWPPGFVLVFHERQKRDPLEPYIRSVQEAGGARTFLSLTPVPFDEVDKVYAGAHIGIVCYQIADQNEETGWSSSGKLVFYLRHGLPIIVVTSKRPSLIAEWHCGIWVTKVEEIGAALAEIDADYAGYSARAKQAYDALFDFRKAFDRLLDTVKQR